MSNLEDYNMKLEVIKAIPDDQIKNPNLMPIRIYIQESEHLYEWCQLEGGIKLGQRMAHQRRS
jgi:hypothetical protein